MAPKPKRGSGRRARAGADLATQPEASAALRRARRFSALATLAFFVAIVVAAAVWAVVAAPGPAGVFAAAIGVAVGAAATIWIHDVRETAIDALYEVRQR